MSDKAVFILAHAEARRRAIANVQAAPDGYKVTIQPPPRSLEQNAKLWAVLTEVSQQVQWHGQHLAPAEWKDVFTAALERQKVVPGIEGGFVVIGSSTSRMSKAKLGELIELIHAFGAERGVEFQDLAVPSPT